MKCCQSGAVTRADPILDVLRLHRGGFEIAGFLTRCLPNGLDPCLFVLGESQGILDAAIAAEQALIQCPEGCLRG